MFLDLGNSTTRVRWCQSGLEDQVACLKDATSIISLTDCLTLPSQLHVVGPWVFTSIACVEYFFHSGLTILGFGQLNARSSYLPKSQARGKKKNT